MASARSRSQAQSPSDRGTENRQELIPGEFHTGAVIRAGHTYSHKNMSHVIHELYLCLAVTILLLIDGSGSNSIAWLDALVSIQ